MYHIDKECPPCQSIQVDLETLESIEQTFDCYTRADSDHVAILDGSIAEDCLQQLCEILGKPADDETYIETEGYIIFWAN